MVKRTMSDSTGVSTFDGGVGEVGAVLRRPALPGARRRVSRLERDSALLCQGVSDRCERGAQLLISDEDLEGLAGHDDQVELPVERDGRQIPEDPRCVRPCSRHVEHPRRGIKPDQPPGVTRVAGHVQEGARPAADVEHGLRGHDHRQVEAKVVSTVRRVEPIAQAGEVGI